MANSQSDDVAAEDGSCQPRASLLPDLHAQADGQAKDSDAAAVASLPVDSNVTQGLETDHSGPSMMKSGKEEDVAAVENDQGRTPIREEAITDMDVLCGGNLTSFHRHHTGNKRLHDLAQTHAKEYVSTVHGLKTTVMKKIVDAVHGKNGRFLKRENGTGSWFEISDKQAKQKAREALYKTIKSIHGSVKLSSASTTMGTEDDRSGKDHGIPEDAITGMDVLLNQVFYSHTGNRKYRELVRARVHEFASTKGVKTDVARTVVDAIHAKNGRFLKKDDGSGTWYEVDNEIAMKEAQDALYEQNQTRIEGNVESSTSSTAVVAGHDKPGELGIPEDAITNDDVLCDNKRSSAYTSHKGNQKYRAFILAHASEYESTKGSKMDVVRKVVSAIHANDGRFLKKKKDDGSGSWFEIANNLALKKANGALWSVMKTAQKNRKSPPVSPADSAEDEHQIHQDTVTGADALSGRALGKGHLDRSLLESAGACDTNVKDGKFSTAALPTTTESGSMDTVPRTQKDDLDKLVPAREKQRSCVAGDTVMQMLNASHENPFSTTFIYSQACDASSGSSSEKLGMKRAASREKSSSEPLNDQQSPNASHSDKLGMKRKSVASGKAPTVKKPKHGNTIQQMLNEMGENITDLTWPFVDGEPSNRKELGMKKQPAEQNSNHPEIVIEIGSLVPSTSSVASAKKKRIGQVTDVACAKRRIAASSSQPSKKTTPAASLVSASKKKAVLKDEPFVWPSITWI